MHTKRKKERIRRGEETFEKDNQNEDEDGEEEDLADLDNLLPAISFPHSP